VNASVSTSASAAATNAAMLTMPWRNADAKSPRLLVRALRVRYSKPIGVDPVEASGLPVWWTQQTLAAHPDFVGEWPDP
jgi:hypothetical protein